MKKRLLSLIAASAAVLFVSAQTWDAPIVTGVAPESGSAYFVYNVGLNGYLARGGSWKMQAVLAEESDLPTSNTDLYWTVTNTSGSLYTFAYNGGAVGLFIAGAGAVYTDNTTDWAFTVAQTDAVNEIYSIQANPSSAYYVADQYLGASSVVTLTNWSYANIIKESFAAGDSTQWKFVNDSTMDLYEAKVGLDRVMNYAKLKGGINLTTSIATYNSNVTADINTTAASLLTTMGATDQSASILDKSFESNDLVTNWTNNGMATQTNTPLFTKDGTYYCEKWITSGQDAVGVLPAASIMQNITGLTNGLYGVSAPGQATGSFGANYMHTGVYLMAGGDSTEVNNAKDVVYVDYIEVTDGTLSLGWKVGNAAKVNWTGFDNFSLTYFGAIVTDVKNETANNCLVTVNDQNVRIVTNEALRVAIYTITGTTVFNKIITSETMVPVQSGIYIVKAGSEVTKVIVK